MDEIAKCWDDKAAQWKQWVGESGDNNRRFNSDPVLKKFAGDVRGKKILDAGCGAGYLAISMARDGAEVIGVDLSQKMIQEAASLALEKKSTARFRVDSCEELGTVPDASIDILVSNYVLMDLPNLQNAVNSIYRVLTPRGVAVCVIGHPFGSELKESENYFDEVKKVDRWGPFDSDFIFFHRPLSQYWKAFREAGLEIVDFDEPVAQNPNIDGFKDEWKATYRKRPWSVAFKLTKPEH
ncbi:MAG: class I SAM-dependent methyltransferase [Bdellovibrionales bacterium]